MLKIKPKKRIIAPLLLCVVIAVIITAIRVNGNDNSNRIPELTLYQKDGYVKAEWALEVLDTDVLFKSSFEEGEFIPTIDWFNWGNGGQSVTTEDKIDGLRSIKVVNTIANSNHRNYPFTDRKQSIMGWGTLFFPNGTPVSLTFKAKTTGTGTIIPYGDGGWGASLTELSNKVAERALVSQNKVKLTTVEGLEAGMFIAYDLNYNSVGPMYAIDHIDTANKVITLSANLTRTLEAGEPLRTRIWRNSFELNPRTVKVSDGWKKFSINGVVADFNDYDFAERGFTFFIDTHTGDTIYLDDVRFGYATTGILYRDGVKVYEGYLSDFEDTQATDKTGPARITNISVKGNSSGLTINLRKPEDRGTTYNYKIKGRSKNGETPLSNNYPITIAPSGIKGYSYIIDKSPTTTPDSTIESTSEQIITGRLDSGRYYLHVRAIDNKGNAGETSHYSISIPKLTAQSNNAENNISLEWEVNDTSQPYSYKLYQKRSGQADYQSISTTSYDKEVRVLNIYPNVGATISFKNWKGESFTLPGSALLKQWMEEPNSEHSKGYGKGIISVEPVALRDFNVNPELYMKNTDGSWKYDVIFFGSWDCNGYCSIDGDITPNTVEPIRSFIESGRGFLTGHDTFLDNTHPNIGSLREYFKVKLGDVDYPNVGVVGSTSQQQPVQLVVQKKGLLTNYPWEIGDVGTILTVPNTHTSKQYIYGDVWIKFNLPDIYAPDGGELNAYLSSWNNTAFIQTGHMNAQATPDEQKVIANTLFYLSQITSETSLVDRSGQDVAPPTKPLVTRARLDKASGKLLISFQESVDNGSEYSYYVEATGQSSNSITTSNIVSATVKSGLKGYSYEVTTNPNTIPDNVVDTTSRELSLVKPQGEEIYFHIRAVDNLGNASETHHVKIEDFTPPTISLELSPKQWTNGNVTIIALVVDRDSGVKNITLPNGNKISSNSATYTVSENGVYYFEAEDYIGNRSITYIVVNTIDRGKPEVSIGNNQEWNNSDRVNVNIQGSDQ